MVNKHPKRSDEPVWWGLFGAGGSWFAMITPITILVLGIFVPFGIIDADSMSYDRVVAFANSWIGFLFIVASIALPMWHAMHRVHHGLHDIKIHIGKIGKFLCYFTATIFTILAIVFAAMV